MPSSTCKMNLRSWSDEGVIMKKFFGEFWPLIAVAVILILWVDVECNERAREEMYAPPSTERVQ